MNKLRLVVYYNRGFMSEIFYFENWYKLYKWFNNTPLQTWKDLLHSVIIEDWEKYKRYEWDNKKFIKIYSEMLRIFLK